MSNKLLEAAILRLRSNVMASAAKIEALLENPLSVGGDSALEEIEMEIIKLGQFEMALATLRKRFSPHEAPGAKEKHRSHVPRSSPGRTAASEEESIVENIVESRAAAPAMADDFKQLIARRGPQTKTRLSGEKK